MPSYAPSGHFRSTWTRCWLGTRGRITDPQLRQGPQPTKAPSWLPGPGGPAAPVAGHLPPVRQAAQGDAHRTESGAEEFLPCQADPPPVLTPALSMSGVLGGPGKGAAAMCRVLPWVCHPLGLSSQDTSLYVQRGCCACLLHEAIRALPPSVLTEETLQGWAPRASPPQTWVGVGVCGCVTGCGCVGVCMCVRAHMCTRGGTGAWTT